MSYSPILNPHPVSQSGSPWGVSFTMPALVAGSAIIGKVGIDQTTPGTTNLVALAANQSVNQTQVNGVTMLTGNGATGTGSMRVTIASDNTAFSVNAVQSGTWNVGSITTLPALVAGTALIGKVGIDQTTVGTTNAVSLAQLGATTILTGNGATGAGSLRVTIASDQTAFSVNAIQATLTKGTQGGTGVSTQDLKDAGRAIVNAATAIAGVTAVTTEALLALNVSRDGAGTSSITTITVTSGKRFRVQAIVASVRSSAATVLSGRVSLRMNPSGAVTATSPVLAILSMTQQAAALAEAGDTCVLPVPDGIEFSGTMQFGLSQVCSGTGGVVYASIIGYEY